MEVEFIGPVPDEVLERFSGVTAFTGRGLGRVSKRYTANQDGEQVADTSKPEDGGVESKAPEAHLDESAPST